MDTLKDPFGRTMDYLRLSVTDRCNLRCVYCTPMNGSRQPDGRDGLSFPKIEQLVRVAAGLGVIKVRITGGEPLMREDLPRLVAAIAGVKGVEDLSLTTNGTLLKVRARSLASAGLRRVNVSLDSLNPLKYATIRRGDRPSDVLEGIAAAEGAGLLPMKVNMVPVRAVNDAEIEHFARLTLNAPYDVRFIELMPALSGDFWTREKCVSVGEMIQRVSAVAPLVPVECPHSGPARMFRFPGGRGRIGFISPMTHRFCDLCNRLRLTSAGRLRPCLFSDFEVDVLPAVRAGASDVAIIALFKTAVAGKPRAHSIDPAAGRIGLAVAMSKIGG